MDKRTLAEKVDLLVDTLTKFIDASHRHNESFRDAIVNLTDEVRARDGQVDALLGKLLALYSSHAKDVETIVEAVADDVKSFDRNLHTMNANSEQRFNAMHLEHDLIIDLLSRNHGNDKRQQ